MTASSPSIETTAIPGLLVLRMPLHRDDRGWFKENWHRQVMSELGLPEGFTPVQHNVAFNARRGTTRGFHAEPWDKLVSLASGRAFGAWVDLREGDTFGATVQVDLDPSVAVFVPRGVGNAYQTLDDSTVYTYLVTQHWNPQARYAAVDLADPSLSVPWPISLDDAIVSDKDRTQPSLADVAPMPGRRVLITGAGGQLARALAAAIPDATSVTVGELDITDASAVAAWPWSEFDVVLNAAAWTDVDGAESPDGRRQAWRVNAEGPAHLARAASQHGLLLVHYSTDYVYDGVRAEHTEDEPLSPLGVYGQTKAAGDLAATATARHYVLRTGWLVGDGHNFVRTMAGFAATGRSPAVVDDQVGRLTFTDELASATVHLLDSGAPYGTYNCTNAGPPTNWAEVARQVFEQCGRSAGDVTAISTAEYAAGKDLAPRPANSVLDLTKLAGTGFQSEDMSVALLRYVQRLSTDGDS